MSARRNIGALIAFIDGRQGRPHAWGREANDCVAFALAAVEAQTGVKVAPELAWSSRTDALRVLRRFGSLEAAFDAHFVRIPPAQAMRGDIGAMPDPIFGIHPMIVEGITLVGPGERGSRRARRTAMVAAWSANLTRTGDE